MKFVVDNSFNGKLIATAYSGLLELNMYVSQRISLFIGSIIDYSLLTGIAEMGVSSEAGLS